MALLRLANSDADRRFLDEAKTEFIDVRSEISKRERNALIKMMPDRPDIEESGITVSEGVEFQSNLFELLVLGWSLDVPATVENYLSLAPDAADLIDGILATVFGAMVPSSDEQGKP
jgi:hypothetical protein